MESVGNTKFGNSANDVVEHIPTACHDKTDIIDPFEYLGCSFNKIVRPLLVGDASQKCDDLIIYTALLGFVLLSGKADCIVNGHHSFRGNAVFVDHDVSGQVTYCNHSVCLHHPGPFNVVNLLIDILSATVKLRCVHMYY